MVHAAGGSHGGCWPLSLLDTATFSRDTVVHNTCTGFYLALERAPREEMRLVLVDALRVQALIDLRQEQWDEAVRSIEEGPSIARSIPYPHAEARLLELSERVHALRGRSEAGPASGAAGLALP